MNIARYNQRITIQQNTVDTDNYGNRIRTWSAYFECAAYASTIEASENVSETATENRTIKFFCRYCPELDAVTSTGYRVLFNGETWNITAVDPMNYQGKQIKITCTREDREV